MAATPLYLTVLRQGAMITMDLTFRTLFSGSMKVFEEGPLATCGMVL
jgi:hypothetical protein